MTEWDITGDYDPPLDRLTERFERDVTWPPPADDPDEEPSEPWAHRGHIWDER
jgi:hypothetical protein